MTLSCTKKPAPLYRSCEIESSSFQLRMPEALSTQLNERNSSCTPDMESPTDLDAVSYENLSRTDRTMSVESLNTLLSQLPEISIPATLFNPLPLQCIAANALPKNVRAEIDGVIAQYTVEGNDGDIEDVDNLTPVLHRALGIEKVATSASVNKPVGPVCKKIIWREVEEETSTGFGLNLCGGMRCNNCSSLHAIVTGVSACLYETEDIVEGICVIEWEGQTLDGCTYEEVQKIMTSIDPGLNKIEISFKKCSENLLISRGGFDWLPSFAAVRLNKRRNAIFEDKGELDCKSTVSYESSELSHIPSSPAHRLSRSQEHLDLPFFPESSLTSCTRSPSHSPSPSEAKKPLAVTVAKEIAQTLLGSMEAPSKPSLCNLQTIMDVLPKGMVQLSLGYNKECEELKISLLQVKGQSNKEFSDPCEVFINTYLVPDYRDQGVRSIVSSQNLKDSTEYQNTSYIMAADEIPCVALRVILWDAHKPKHIMFRGEVLLSLSDQQFVNLASEPTWYTLCPEDPNLSKLPSPVYSKQKNSVDNLLQKLKQKAHSLTTVKPLSSELRSMSMLSLQGPVEKRTMTLARKKHRKETRKTYSGSFTPQLVDCVLQPEAQLKSCLKESCRQQKLSSILKVLREDSVDNESSETKKHNKHIIDEHTDGNSLHTVNDAERISTLQRRLRNKSTANNISAERMSLPGKTDKNGKSFLEELDELISQRNFGLQPTPERRDKTPEFEKEQMHYKLVDSYQSEDEHDKPQKPTCSPFRTSKPSDFSRYSAEVSLHRIRVEDTDRKEESKKKSCTLPNEHTSQHRPTTLLPARGGSDKRPPKPPKTYRSKSMGHIEKLGSDEELFIVRSHHMTNSIPVESAYKTMGSVDDLDLIELMSHSSSYDGHSSLDFGNRFGSCDVLGERGDAILERSSPVREYREDAEEIQREKGLIKTKWRSLEDILASKPRKSKEKKLKTNRKDSPCETDAHTHTFLRRRTVQESGASCNVKLEFQFNDLNPTNPVLLVKLTDIALPSSKMLSSDLLLKCYVNHLSTGVCILKDKTPICLMNNPSSAPLGILQFRTDIANLALQIRLYGGSKMFSRKVIGQVSVNLAVLDLSGGKTHSQWFLLSKQICT